MPDLGIGEAIGGLLGGGDLLAGLGSLFGGGAAAAAPEVGAATIGAGAGAAGAGDLGALVGTGEGLFGGSTGLAGTALAGGAGTDLGALAGAGGATAAGTAADFLAAPAASGFNAGALTPGISAADLAAPAGAPGGGAGVLGAVPGIQPSGVGGVSVFDTGTSAVPGVSPTGTPAPVSGNIAPAGASAVGSAAPSSVVGTPDATATVPGATGATSVGGAPLNAAPSSSISQLLNPQTWENSIVKSLTSNPLGIGLGAAGLGYSIYNQSQNTKNVQNLENQAATEAANANQLTQQGNQLTSYLTSGTLPPGYQVQVTQAINSAIANAKSNAAQQGLSTDPTQNTALAATIAQIQDQQPILQEQLAAQLASTGGNLLSTGASVAGISGNLYSSLVQNDTTQAANTGKAIAALAAALGGKSQASLGGQTITIGSS
jgi:hypothetical protein